MSFLESILESLGGYAMPGGPGATFNNFEDRFPQSGMPVVRGGGDTVPDFPNGVPMPRERPMEAGPQASDLELQPPPPIRGGGGLDLSSADIRPGMRGIDTAANGGQSGFLESLFAGPQGQDRIRRLVSGIGAGLANVKNSPFKGEVFAQAAGAGMQGGEKRDDTTYEQKLKALDRALKLRQIDQLGTYRDESLDLKGDANAIRRQDVTQRGAYNDGRLVLGSQLNGIRQQTADARTAVVPSVIARNEGSAAAANARAGEAPSRIARNEAQTGYYGARTTESQNKAAGIQSPARSMRDADLEAQRWWQKESTNISESRKRIQAAPMPPREKLAKMAELDQAEGELKRMYEERRAKNRADYLAAGKGQPRAAPGQPDEISMQGNGTRQTPYSPSTPDDFTEIPSGSHYIDPGDGKLYRKP